MVAANERWFSLRCCCCGRVVKREKSIGGKGRVGEGWIEAG